MSSPLSDVFSEIFLLSMDRAVTRHANRANLHRLHDDLWIRGPQDECVKAWHALAEFTHVLGLKINENRFGSVVISQNKRVPSAVASHKKHVPEENVPGSNVWEEKLPSSGNISGAFRT